MQTQAIESQADMFKAFLETCEGWDEFNDLLDVALEHCFAADLVMAKTGRIWLLFRDESDCFVSLDKLPK